MARTWPGWRSSVTTIGSWARTLTVGVDFPAVLAAAQAGDETAVAVLYRDLNPRLVRYLAVRAPGAAEDLASEVWLAAAGHLSGFVGNEGAFRAWMFTIARHQIAQHWRQAARRPNASASDDDLVTWAGGEDPQDLVSSQAAVRELVGTLAGEQAEVVLLRVLGGFSVEEVARILKKRPGAVRVIQHRALRKLAKSFPTQAVTQ